MIFILKEVMTSKSPCILLKRNRKWQMPPIFFDRQTFCFTLYKSHKLKVNLWWVGACESKKRAVFVAFILSEIFSRFVLSQFIVYWINFKNIHTFTYQKTLLHTLLLLVFQIPERLRCILKDIVRSFGMFY